MRQHLRTALLTSAAATLVGALVSTSAAAAQVGPRPSALRVTVLASKLNGPRHITVAPNMGIFVALAGAGGKDCVNGPSVSGKGTTKYCEGLTGAFDELGPKGLRTVEAKQPSVLEQDTGEPAGPAALAFSSDGSSFAYVFQDELVTKTGKNTLPGSAHTAFGTMVVYRHGSRVETVNLAAFAAAHPQNPKTMGGVPGETPFDSDPYDVISYLGGWVVTDAAANSLLYVSRAGKVSLLARFPTEKETVPAGVFGPSPVTIYAQAVPTAVAVGPDGALYVGILRGVPSEPGTSQIYRVVPGEAPTVWARGLTAVTAIAFDGPRLLATELSVGGLLAAPKAPGALVEVVGNGAGEKVVTLPVHGLTEPTGLAVVDGTVYVANSGATVGTGQLLRITGL